MSRLPQESRAMYNELIAKLKRTICETKMERQERVEKALEKVMMGRLADSAFGLEPGGSRVLKNLRVQVWTHTAQAP